jgi:hypothetical protein
MEETESMTTPRQQYLEACRKVTPRIAFCQALMRRIPKKYEQKVIALIRARPELVHTQRLEISSVLLGYLWRCHTAEVEGLLKRMTARSKGEITYHIGDTPVDLGYPVTLIFSIPEAMEPEAVQEES